MYLRAAKLNHLPGDPLDARQALSRPDALSQIDDREVYGAGIQAAAGPAGTALVILMFVILGNSASGGPFARPLLPGLWRTIGGVLPPGASVDLARSALYFDGATVAGPIVVLAVWSVFGTALALALGGRIMDPTETEAEAAAGAAV